MKSLWNVVLALVIGFLVSAMAFRARPVKAQEPGSVHVFILAVEVDSDNATRSVNVPGGKVAGMSCVPDPQARRPKAVTCYVATSPN
jgi:hypothetical protein